MIYLEQIKPECLKDQDNDNIIMYPCSPIDVIAYNNLKDKRLLLYKLNKDNSLTFIKKLDEEMLLRK